MIKISLMRESDIKEAHEIEVASFTTPWSEFLFLKDVKENPNSVFLAAKEDGKIVGYGGFWIILDEMNIVNLAVRSSDRKKGIGSRILTELLKEGMQKGAKVATLEVRESNLAAQKLYEKFGFKVIAIRKKYYQDKDENAVVMWLNPVEIK